MAMTQKYRSELAKYDQTIEEALESDISLFCQYLSSIASQDIVAVGSGGSFTAAQYIADVHESITGNLGVARTPLEYLTGNPSPKRCIALISASGRNKDILKAFEHARSADVRHLLVITNNSDSPLAEKADELGNALSLCLNLSIKRDGYLATNTLLGTMVAIYNGYRKTFSVSEKNSIFLEDLLHPDQSEDAFLAELSDRLNKLKHVDTLLVLHGGWGAIGAVDTESRMSESGLKNVQNADVRSFAHGRHQWIVKNQDSTGVVAFDAPEVSPIMSKTLERLPDDIPVVHFSTDHQEAKAGLVHALYAMHLPMVFGDFAGIDPGRPDVPGWARRIHHLTPTLDRKESSGTAKLAGLNNPPENFLSRLTEATFSGIVVDYDGTLVTTHGRFDPPDEEISEEVERLVQDGLKVGVATGRGKSAGQDLRRVLPDEIWDDVWIGYYNGTDVASLANSDAPDGTHIVKHEQLSKCMDLLRNECSGMFEIEARPKQISIEGIPEDMTVEEAWFFVTDLLSQHDQPAKILISGHSLDVLPKSASKRAVLQKISDVISSSHDEILRIGDRAAWPGNDHELLSHPLGISVDQSVAQGEGGYRLTPVGIRGPAATVRLLRSIQATDDGWMLDVEHATNFKP